MAKQSRSCQLHSKQSNVYIDIKFFKACNSLEFYLEEGA